MKRITQLLLTFAFALGIGLTVTPAGTVSAINVLKDQCAENAKSGAAPSTICEAAKDDNATSMTTTIINTMLYLIGILSVIVIIFGGIRYVTSTGDASRVKAAKETIMYAVIGLVVAILAYSIVNFVLSRFN